MGVLFFFFWLLIIDIVLELQVMLKGSAGKEYKGTTRIVCIKMLPTDNLLIDYNLHSN